MENSRKISYDQNDQPPKNYIWYKNGQYLEWNGEKWVASTGMNSKESISSDMTEEQKMEARKNLGLYYEETSVGEKEVQYNGEAASFNYWAKVSDDTPAKTDIVSVAGNPASDETMVAFPDNTDGYNIYPIGAPSGVGFRVVLNDSDGHEPGIYYNTLGAEYANVVSLVYKGETTTVSKIDPKYIKDMYYEETSISEKTAKFINEPESALTGYAKVSDDTPAKDDILFVLFMGYEEEFTTTDTEDGFLVNSPTTHAVGVVRVVLSNSQGNEPGIYAVMSVDQYGVVYNGPTTTIHKIDAKFLPEQESGGELNVAELTALPESTMTTQTELDAIGLTDTVVQKLTNYEYVGLTYITQVGVYRLGILACKYIGAMGYTLIFQTDTDVYKITKSLFGITVTITPLS